MIRKHYNNINVAKLKRTIENQINDEVKWESTINNNNKLIIILD